MPKKANTDARVRMSVKDKVAARPVTMAAKAKTPAKAREAALVKESSPGSSA